MGCSWFKTETNKRKTSINNKNMHSNSITCIIMYPFINTHYSLNNFQFIYVFCLVCIQNLYNTGVFRPMVLYKGRNDFVSIPDT